MDVQSRNSALALHRWVWPLVIVLSSIGVSVVALANVHSPIRTLLALWFLCICPGMAFVRLLDIEARYIQLTLAIALSLALDTAVATAMLYAHLWSPTHILGLLAVISLGAVVLDVAVVHRTRRPASGTHGYTAPSPSARLEVAPDVAHVAPGDRRVLALTAHNDSSAAGRYHIEVGGLPPEWYDLDRPQVVLGPGSSERVALTVHPPAGTAPATRSYRMTVRMRAEDDLSIQAASIVTVLVSAPDALDMDVQPTEVAGEEAIFCVTFLNQSAVPASIQLLVHDDQNGLRVHVTPETSVLVPAGATSAPLFVDVAPRRQRRHGAPQTYEIEFRGRALGDEALMHPDLVLQARFTYVPPGAASRLGRWLTRVFALLSLVPLLLTAGCLPGYAEAPWQSDRRSGVPRSPG